VPNADDWNTINPADGLSRTGAFGASTLSTFINDTGTTDTFFTGGSSKDFEDVEPNWLTTTTSVPDKDEIDHGYAALYTDNSANCGTTNTCGHNILVFGGDRHATNGDSNIGFWFFQGAVGVDVPNQRFTGHHVNGDLFMVSAFTKAAALASSTSTSGWAQQIQPSLFRPTSIGATSYRVCSIPPEPARFVR